MEEEGKTHFFLSVHDEEHFRLFLLKQLLAQQFLRGDDLVFHLFIFCQRSDELQDQAAVLFICKSKSIIFH